MEPTPTEVLIPIGEAARRVGVSVDTIRRWSDEGRLRTVILPSGHRRFRAADIDALREGDTA